MGCVLAEPQGRHRRDGFVHSADGFAPTPLRLLVIEHGCRHIVHSTPRSTRRRRGRCSNYARRFPTTQRRDTTSLTVTLFSAPPWSSSSGRWEQSRFAFPTGVLGRTGPPNAGSPAVGASSLSTMSSSASAIWFDSCRSYICCYHEHRCHLGLNKDTPNARTIMPRPSPTASVVALSRVGGLHHRYEWREAA